MISGVSAAHHISLPGLLTLTSHMMEAGQNLLSRPFPELFLSERHVEIDKGADKLQAMLSMSRNDDSSTVCRAPERLLTQMIHAKAASSGRSN